MYNVRTCLRALYYTHCILNMKFFSISCLSWFILTWIENKHFFCVFSGSIQSKIVYYLMNIRVTPRAIYICRVRSSWSMYFFLSRKWFDFEMYLIKFSARIKITKKNMFLLNYQIIGNYVKPTRQYFIWTLNLNFKYVFCRFPEISTIFS